MNRTKSPKAHKPRRLGPLVAAVVPAALLAASLTSCSSKVGYAAIVNGVVISQDQLNQELADIAANPDYVRLLDQPGSVGPVEGVSPGSYNKSFVAAVLDEAVRYEVARQALAANNALPTPAQVAASKPVIANQVGSAVFAAFGARYQNLLATEQAESVAFFDVITKDLSGDSLDQYYQAHQIDYTSEVCVRHILITDKDQSGQLDLAASLADAQRVKGLVDAGGDFAALAKQYSQDNQGTNGGSANQGGVLAGRAADGCNTISDLQQLPSALALTVVQAPLDQLSTPVKTQLGYELVQVTKRVIEPLDQRVTTDIHRRVGRDRLNNLIVKANVKVNPEFGSFDKTPTTSGQIPGVTPPLVPDLVPTTTLAGAPGSTGTPAGAGG